MYREVHLWRYILCWITLFSKKKAIEDLFHLTYHVIILMIEFGGKVCVVLVVEELDWKEVDDDLAGRRERLAQPVNAVPDFDALAAEVVDKKLVVGGGRSKAGGFDVVGFEERLESRRSVVFGIGLPVAHPADDGLGRNGLGEDLGAVEGDEEGLKNFDALLRRLLEELPAFLNVVVAILVPVFQA